MRGSIPVPERTSGEVHNSFQTIQAQLDQQRIPLILQKENLRHLKEGQSAWHPEGDQLCLYTRYNRRLYRTACDALGQPVDLPFEISPIYSSEIGDPIIRPSLGNFIAPPPLIQVFAEKSTSVSFKHIYLAGLEPTTFEIRFSKNMNGTGDPPSWVNDLLVEIDDEDLRIDVDASEIANEDVRKDPANFQAYYGLIANINIGGGTMAQRQSGFASLIVRQRTDTTWTGPTGDQNPIALTVYEGFQTDYNFTHTLSVGDPAPDSYEIEVAKNPAGDAVDHTEIDTELEISIEPNAASAASRTARIDAGNVMLTHATEDIAIYYRLIAVFNDTNIDNVVSEWTSLTIKNAYEAMFMDPQNTSMFEGTVSRVPVVFTDGQPMTPTSALSVRLSKSMDSFIAVDDAEIDTELTAEYVIENGAHFVEFDATDITTSLTEDKTVYYQVRALQPDAGDMTEDGS